MGSESSGSGDAVSRASTSLRISARATAPWRMRDSSMSSGLKHATITIERRARVIATASSRSPPSSPSEPKSLSTRPCGVRP